MKMNCYLEIVLGLFLVVLISGLAPDAAFSQGRRGGRVEQPSVSAPPSDTGELNSAKPVKTAPAIATEKAFLGVQVQKLRGTPAWRWLGRFTGRSEGVLVSDVIKDSTAEQMGIKQQDVILACNYKDVKSPEEFTKAVSA